MKIPLIICSGKSVTPIFDKLQEVTNTDSKNVVCVNSSIMHFKCQYWCFMDLCTFNYMDIVDTSGVKLILRQRKYSPRSNKSNKMYVNKYRSNSGLASIYAMYELGFKECIVAGLDLTYDWEKYTGEINKQTKSYVDMLREELKELEKIIKIYSLDPHNNLGLEYFNVDKLGDLYELHSK